VDAGEGSVLEKRNYHFLAPDIPKFMDLPFPLLFEKPLNSLSSAFSRGAKWKEFFVETAKALLPLKKGGREGFLEGPIQSAKVLKFLKVFKRI